MSLTPIFLGNCCFKKMIACSTISSLETKAHPNRTWPATILASQKTSATGTLFQFNHIVDYDLNNSPSNRFNDRDERSFAYDTFFEGFFRQPLLQGAGVTFNRIAGPNNLAGVNRGVLVARANTDMALAEFESKIRDLVSDIENAYWDLYFAYRDLEAKIEARNGAYDIWRNLEANKGEKSAAVIGQAKEQYYRFAADVEDAIHGRPVDGTRTQNGSAGGTFRRTGGVRTAERRLRLIIGMTPNDSQLIVPVDMPTNVNTVFDWNQARSEALSLRPELRRQRWMLKRNELELLANKNHLLPRVDVLGKYRFKGFGHDLFGDGNELNIDGTVEEQLDSSAFGTLLNGNLQEWELGLDMSVPIGFRQQHAAVRNAELNLAREKAILKEQERQIIFGLSNAIGELHRTNRVRTANTNRLDAAEEQFEAISNIWQEQDTTIDLVLEAQRRVIESKLQYFQTQVETMLAVKAIHFEKGTLFEYHGIRLAEEPSTSEAQRQAAESVQRRVPAMSYTVPGLQIAKAKAQGGVVSPIDTSNSYSAPAHSMIYQQPIYDQQNSQVISLNHQTNEGIVMPSETANGRTNERSWQGIATPNPKGVDLRLEDASQAPPTSSNFSQNNSPLRNSPSGDSPGAFRRPDGVPVKQLPAPDAGTKSNGIESGIDDGETVPVPKNDFTFTDEISGVKLNLSDPNQ